MKRGQWKWLGIATAAAALLAIGGGAATSAAGPAGSEAASATIKVGVIYSKTGLLSAYGEQYVDGLKAGLKYVSKGTGKVGANKVEFTFIDDAGDPAKAAAAFKDLVGQGYKIIIGPVSSGVALTLAPLAAQNQILFISGPAANDGITGNNKYTFRSGRQTTQDVLTIRAIIGPKEVGKKIVVFAQDSAFGQGNLAAVRAVLGGFGHTVSSILVPLSATDFTPFAQQAKKANADLYFVAWAGTTAPAVWRAFEQAGIAPKDVATGLAERATWQYYVPGIRFLSHYTTLAPKSPVNDWLRKEMKKQKKLSDLFTPDGFVAAQMIGRAITKGGGSDVGKMVDALEGWQFMAPKGIQRVRESDHAMAQPMFEVKLVQAGGAYQAQVVKRYSPATVMPAPKPFTG
ncbi:MAG TPA: substrate-binding domain-containing protein [Gaiellaceae bacterium]|nr:substrate-binding domain-containing protein [Gaiellaceae bacterium]